VPHGSFLPWIDAEFAMSEATAKRMMSVARMFAGKSITLSDLNASALYEPAAQSTPPEVQAEVERRIAAGGGFERTVAVLLVRIRTSAAR